eukprot:403343265
MSYQVSLTVEDKNQSKSILSVKLQNQNEDQSKHQTINIHVLNTETLDEFECSRQFDNDYLDKLQHWISKNKYQCFQPAHNDITQVVDDEHLFLKVDIFDFALRRKQKSDLDKIKEEMALLKQDKLQQDLKVKMFNMQFFCNWKDQLGGFIQGTHLNNNYIQDISQLYFILEGVGQCIAGSNQQQQIQQQDIVSEHDVDSEEQSSLSNLQFNRGLGSAINQGSIDQINQSSKNKYFIGFPDQLSNEIMNSTALQIQRERNKKPTFNVIIYGPGCKNHMIVKMSSQCPRTDVQSSSKTYYYPINVSVRDKQRYSIYIPRIFA